MIEALRCWKKTPAPPYPCKEVEIVAMIIAGRSEPEESCNEHLTERIGEIQERYSRKFESHIRENSPKALAREIRATHGLEELLPPDSLVVIIHYL